MQETPGMSPGKRLRRKRIALSVTSILLMLVCTEIALRIAGPRYHKFNNRSDLYYSNPRGYHRRVGSDGGEALYGIPHQATREGFRAPDTSTPEAAAAWKMPCDVLALGDSFTFGRGVYDRDIYVSRIASALQKGGKRVRIRNAGMNGADIEEMLMIHNTVRKREPYKLVIYGFVLNDFGLPDIYKIVGRDLIDQNNGGYSYNPWRRRIALVNFVAGAADRIRLHRTTIRAYQEAFRGARADRGFEMLRQLRTRVVDDGARFAIVLFPLLYDFGDYPFREAHEKLAAFCARERIPFLDLLPVFASHTAESLWVHPTDHHPNETGHRLAADAVTGFLLEQRLVPGSELE